MAYGLKACSCHPLSMLSTVDTMLSTVDSIMFSESSVIQQSTRSIDTQ